MIYQGSNEIAGIKLGSNEISAIYIGSEMMYPVETECTNYVAFSAASSQGVSVSTASSLNLQYSYDRTAWSALSSSVTFGTSENPVVYVRGKGNTTFDSSKFVFSNSSVMVAVSGNVMSLLNYRDSGATTLSSTYAFRYLFSGATALQTVSEGFLPATTLSMGCYQSMFQGCTHLTSVPALPASALTYNCYYYMFSKCSALVNAPALPATSLAYGCYDGMFESCTSLTTGPALPATNLASNCYSEMFKGCTALVNAPALLATNIASYCYYSMFNGCTALVNAPALPATSLNSYCYSNMFTRCTSLVKAPVLPASALVSGCYTAMFSRCSALSSITCYAISGVSTSTTLNWALDVASSGTFYGYSVANWAAGENGIPTTWFADFYDCINLNDTANTNAIKLALASSATVTPNVEYSLNNGRSWTTWDYEYVSFSGNATALHLRGVNESGFNQSDTDFRYFVYSANTADNPVKMTGNIMALINYNTLPLVIPNNYCFYYLFSNNDALTYVAEDFLPATGLTEYCYGLLFRYSGNITESPALPATTLAPYCYISMYRACTGLKSGPITLPATNLSGADYCYAQMFSGCTALTEAPTLPATTLANYCYYRMFYINYSLTKLPTLPATNLSGTDKCYAQMFGYCTGITTVPTNYLPATVLGTNSYWCMFTNCTGIVNAKVNLPATAATYGCYYGMYNGCTSLTGVPATLPATKISEESYLAMYKGCTSLKSGPALPATNLSGATDCYNQMFSGCTALTTSPALPATVLAESCYQAMFGTCSSLTTPPALPATGTMPYACYYKMFYFAGLTKSPTVLPATTLSAGSYSNMFYGCDYMTTVPVICATTVATNSCYAMFQGCKSITKAPALPVTNLSGAQSCYAYMFAGASALTSAPALPATTLAQQCYQGMFLNCYSLKKAPVLSAETLNVGSYARMFEGCSGLTSITCMATSISADSATTNWVSGVASAGTFSGKSAALWTVNSVDGIPSGWTKYYDDCLTFTTTASAQTVTFSGTAKPVIYWRLDDSSTWAKWKYGAITFGTATTNEVHFRGVGNTCINSGTNYQSRFVFANSAAPVTIKNNMMALLTYNATSTTVTDRCFYLLFNSNPAINTVQSTILPATTLGLSCYNGMFSACTSLTSVPALPASELKMSCYASMFRGCTSLTASPTLSAATLVTSCYQNMFSGCTALKKIKCYATDISATDCTTNWVAGVAATGNFYGNTAAGWSSGVSGIPAGWTSHLT